MLRQSLCVLTLTSFALVNVQTALAEIDITDRAVTDPLIKIQTLESLLASNDKLSDKMRVDETRKPPIYKTLLQKTEVFVVHPMSRDTPGVADFSAITTQSKGVLRLAARQHPNGDCVLEVFKGGKSVERKTLDAPRWQTFQIPFDHEPVVVKNFANGWMAEYAFLTYSISKAP